MNEFLYLRFFDKNGHNHQFSLDDNNIYQGSINLPRVSVNLIETDHLFILEEFKEGYSKPKSISKGHSIFTIDITRMAENSFINITDNNTQNYTFNINNYTFLWELIDDIRNTLNIISYYNVEIKDDKLIVEVLHDEYYNILNYDYNVNPIQFNFVGNIDYNIDINDYYPRFRIRFSDNETNFFLYDVNVNDNKPYINNYRTINRILNYDSNDSIDNITFQKSSNNLIDGTSVINLGFQSSNEVYELNNLIIEFSNRINEFTTIANIELYAESVEEEERFKYVLQNFGRTISEKDFFTFRQSDINEANIDYQILNEKRKEYLLQLKELDPYIGSYKGLLNALNYFGYSDLKVKEWWCDLSKDSNSFEKYVLVDIEQNNTDITRSTKFKKTNMFSLVYDINTISCDEDQFGIPLTNENFQFSFEEIIIKLFCLKDVLKANYMPINTKIVDISGEGTYFDKYNLKVWNDQHTANFVDVGIDLNWNTNDIFGFINDIRLDIYNKYSDCSNNIKPICTYNLEKLSDTTTLSNLNLSDTVCIDELEQTYSVVTDSTSTNTGNIPLITNDGVYFTTVDGGTNSLGGLYLYDGVIVKLLYSFTLNDGYEPSGNIVLNSQKLYIETVKGGVNNFGTIICYDISTKLTDVLLNFDNMTGHSMNTILSVNKDKILYDCWLYITTNEGGTNNQGTIIKLNIINKSYKVLFNITTVASTSVQSFSKGVSVKYGNFIYIYADQNVYKINVFDDTITIITLPVTISGGIVALRGGFRYSYNQYISLYNGLGNSRIAIYNLDSDTYTIYNGLINTEFWNGFEYQGLPHLIDLFSGNIYKIDNNSIVLTNLDINNLSILVSDKSDDKLYYWRRSSGSNQDELYLYDIISDTNTLIYDIKTSFIDLNGNNFIDVGQSPLYLQVDKGYNQCPSKNFKDDINVKPSLEPYIANNFIYNYLNLSDDFFECVPTRRNSEVGFIINLTTKSFEVTWNDLDFTWDQLITIPNSSWGTIGLFDFYELEWEIVGSGGFALEQSYKTCYRGTISDLSDFDVIVPYIGQYTITLRAYELNGNVSYETKESIINVDMYNSDFSLITNLVDVETINNWTDISNISWNDINGSWNLPKKIGITIDQAFANWDSLTINKYFNSEYKVLNLNSNAYTNLSQNILQNNDYFEWNKYLDFKYMTWDQLNGISFSKITNCSWEHFIFQPYIQSGFEIRNVFPSVISNPSITINSNTYVLNYTNPITQSDWDNLALDLESTFEDWQFTARPLNNSSYIHAVYKYQNYNPLNYNISVSDWIIDEFNYSNGYYLYDDVYISKDNVTLTVGTPFLLVTDPSKIFGKTNVTWKIYDSNTKEILLDVQNLWMHFILPRTGEFDIECIIEDSNGNIKTMKKNRFIKSI